MDKDKADKAAKAFAKKQAKIMQQWKTFATTYGREAFQDLMDYANTQKELYIQYGSELQMPSPNGKGKVPIDLTTAAILLQNRRGVDIIQTYILSRVNDQGVAQPK